MRLVVVLCLLALWPSAARAEWLQASSAHFVIYADDTERDIKRFSDRLERYHAAMAFITGAEMEPPSPSNRITVYVVRSEREVRKLYGANSKYLGGFYVPRAGGSLAIVPQIDSGAGASASSMTVLLHEYAHHFLMSTSAFATPRWLSEGAAEFMASTSFGADGGVEIGKPAMHRAAELLLPQFAIDVKAADLLDPAAYEKRRRDSYDAFYGKSWLLYHYLIFDKARSGQLKTYIKLLLQGKSSREAGLEALGDFTRLEADLDRYVKSRMFKFTLPADLLKTEPVTVRRLSAGEAAVMPVRIRSKIGVNDGQAKALLVDARTVAARFPEDAAVLAALAEAEHDADNDKEAVAAADAALARNPAEVNAYVQKGRALMRIAADAAPDAQVAIYEQARSAFLTLNRRENDHPLPLIYNYQITVEQGRQPSAQSLRGLERATIVAPFDLGLRMNLAMQQLRAGHREKARLNLVPVAYNPHAGGLAKAAIAALERIDRDPKWDGSGMSAPAIGDDVASEGGSQEKGPEQ